MGSESYERVSMVYSRIEKVKGKQLPGTHAIRTKVPPSKPKPKWEITKVIISQNTKRTNGNLNELAALSQRVTIQLHKPNSI